MNESNIGYFSGKNLKNNVTYFLENNARLKPDHPIFYWVKESETEHNKITFNEFTIKSSLIAAGYLKLGIKEDDRVIVFLPMSTNLYLVISSLQRIGAIPVFLDSWSRRIHLQNVIAQIKPKAIITFEQAFEFCKAIPEIKSIPIKIEVGENTKKYSANLEELAMVNEIAPIVPLFAEQSSLITFTTGSSGTPKGVDRTHRFLSAQHHALEKFVPYKNNDIDMPTFPVFALNNIASGVSTVIPAVDLSSFETLNPAVLLAQMESCKVTCSTFSPAIFNKLSKYCIENGQKLPPLRRVITGGAPISREDLSRFESVANGTENVILYGSTEVEPIAYLTAKEWFIVDNQKTDGVNVGHIVEGLRHRFIKINKNPITIEQEADWLTLEVETGEIGELLVAGEHVCDRYFENPLAWKSTKIIDLDDTVWHRTGDLGKIDSRGFLWIVGRIHNAIFRGGKYLYPVSAEIVLKELPFVSQAAYLGLPDPKLGEKAVAVIVRKKLSDNDSQEITNTLNKYSFPVDDIIFLESMPMDPRHHSKVEYGELRELLEAQE